MDITIDLLKMAIRPVVTIILFSLLSCNHDRVAKVGIQPFGDFDRPLTDTVANALRKTFGVQVYVLESRALPREAFTNVKTPRYRADKIIGMMKAQKPDSLDYILSLTAEDISTTKRDRLGMIKKPESKYLDWGVFGLGYRPGPTCIVSTFRLKDTSYRTFTERLKKVSIHELGHNLGLEHCESALCVMSDAVETIKTIDREEANFCQQCREELDSSFKP